MLSYKYKVFALIILLFLCSVGISVLLCYGFSDMRINRITDSMNARRGRMHLTAQDDNALLGLDETLKSNISAYKGYIYESNVLHAEAKLGNKVSTVPVMLVSRTMLEEAAFFHLQKGETLSYDDSEMTTAILTGDRLANIKLDTALSITIFSENGQTSMKIAARVSGKADKLYAIPEYKQYSSKDFLEYSQNLILLPDRGEYDHLFEQRKKTVVLLNDYMTFDENNEYVQLVQDQSGIARISASGGSYSHYYNLSTLIISVAVSAIFLIITHLYINKLLKSFSELSLSSEVISMIIVVAVAVATIFFTVLTNLIGSWRSLRFGNALVVLAVSQLPLFIKNMVSFIISIKNKKAEKDMHYEKI